ncbi:CoA-binding protein [Verrucomicrobiaceae bacterium R5-34]|nr:CoA-binding protein [Verrucomicrobiaceae bacterium R5-34]
MKTSTLIIGASAKPDRYANKAQRALSENGHSVIPYNPRGGEIDGLQVVTDLADIEQEIDTITLYVRSSILEPLVPDLIALKPRRVIFNPGTEDAASELAFSAVGVEVVRGCTLVMLGTGQYG